MTMGKMKKLKFTKSYVGATAYTVSRVWRLGFHLFKSGGDIIFRLCYFRNSHATYYMQIAYQYREDLTTPG